MKKRKKLIKKIGVLMCALLASLSFLGISVPVFASDLSMTEIYGSYSNQINIDCLYDYSISFTLEDVRGSSAYQDIYFDITSDSEIAFVLGRTMTENFVYGSFNYGTVYFYSLYFFSRSPIYCSDSNVSFSFLKECQLSDGSKVYGCSYTTGRPLYYDELLFETDLNYYGYFEQPVSNTLYMREAFNAGLFDIDNLSNASIYNSSLGYLQNVKHNVVFDDVPLGENVGETFTERWYYDSFSTTGVDLSSGDYVIRYYQEKWIVTGYGEDDIVKKSGRYVLGDYIVQNGYIETYSESVESTLAGQGYVEPSIFDLLWNKFVTTHYYFQIVNTKTNEVGGLLHVYLTDDNGKFGVEHVGETLDNDGNYDEGGYKDFIDEDKITTDDVEQGFNELEQDNEQTLEEWLDNLGETNLEELEGSDAFSVVFRSYVSQVSEVSNAIGLVFEYLPPWFLGLIGLSVVLLFVLMILKEC